MSNKNFIQTIIDDDLAAGRHTKVTTRFPPEPNGYLHIGHAKSICLNFGLATEYNGVVHLRFDDTNPTTEDTEFVDAIQHDIKWLGFDWGDNRFFTSDYFEQLYQFAVVLIKKGLAYVCDQTLEEMRDCRGTVNQAGTCSPGTERTVEENLDLFARMRAGEFKDGERTLRARIDMANANMKMRDPALYRIRHAHHHRTGNDWCIYPMYDFAHCLSDAIEAISHSICTLEFQNNRELYDWLVLHAEPAAIPHQYEFARLNITYTVLSKRKLLLLVKKNHVDGWDDPRMPTLAGLRRRGVPAQAIREFVTEVGVAKANSVVDVLRLENSIRNILNETAPRYMAVLNPLPITITDWKKGTVDLLTGADGRQVPFDSELLIERDDFMEDASPGFKRLIPGGEVRLRHGYVLRCDEVVRDATGNVTRLLCSHDPETRGGTAPVGRKVRGTIHWVSAAHAIPVVTRLYDRLFLSEEPDAAGDFLGDLNPDSLRTVSAMTEPALGRIASGSWCQLERVGYFFSDPLDSKPGVPVLNRVVALRDSWTKKKPITPSVPVKTPTTHTAKGRLLTQTEAASAGALQTRGIGKEQSEVLSQAPLSLALFEATVNAGAPASTAANWVINHITTDTAHAQITGPKLAELINCIDTAVISNTIGRRVLLNMIATGRPAKAVIAAEGLQQQNDNAVIAAAVQGVLEEHSDEVARYQAGEKKLIGFLIGATMRTLAGKGNPGLVREMLMKALT